MKQKAQYEKSCVQCEHSQEIFDGEFCICKKKGVVSPHFACKKFCFDPLKIKVSVPTLPQFHPLTDFLK